MFDKNPACASITDILCKLLQNSEEIHLFPLEHCWIRTICKKTTIWPQGTSKRMSPLKRQHRFVPINIISQNYVYKSEKIKHRRWSRVTSGARKRRFRLGLSNATRSMDRSKLPPRHTLSQIVMVITAVSQFYLLSNLHRETIKLFRSPSRLRFRPGTMK